MNHKKFNRIVNNPRHISGVHNYCDAWCKYCKLTLRCSVFAINQAADAERCPPHDKADDAFWPRVDSLHKSAAKMLAEHADHPGIPMAKNPRFKGITQRRGKGPSPLKAAAERYLEYTHAFCDQWMAKEDKPEKISTLPPVADSPITLEEAFNLVHWFHYMIPVKISRSLSANALDEELRKDLEFADMPRDEDGSAKIALIAIDRSILAWSVLARVEQLKNAALPALLTLDRLRRNLEKQFPEARTFVRPGFDTVRFK